MNLSVGTLKTEAGNRIIPLFPEVRKALIQVKTDQFERGIRCEQVIDGYSDFIFINRFGNIFLPMDINRAIVRVYKDANRWEKERAEKEHRTPIEIRHFSVHNLRHTFCTRLCEVESNLKVIMSIMGHVDIKTTMNTYNELQESKKKEAFENLKNKLMIV